MTLPWQNGSLDRKEIVEDGSPIIIFCENFFDQFFAALGYYISGFDTTAKKEAVELVERLRLKETETKHTRAIITLFEKFCNMYSDVLSGVYSGGSITYQEFHTDYMRILLQRAHRWAEVEEFDALAERIADARTVYDKVMKARDG